MDSIFSMARGAEVTKSNILKCSFEYFTKEH